MFRSRPAARPAAPPRSAASRGYRALWRWHFYAGLIVAPFLLILSVTGAIYLFNDEIDDALHPELRFVAAHAADVAPARLVRAALRAHPGTPTRIDMPAARDRPAVVFVTPARGDPLRVPVDPGTGRVLGSFVYTHGIVGMAEGLHASLLLGYWGGVAMELAACWALVLIATGLFLWWPRGARGAAGVFRPRLAARGRPFWRDLHAVTGVWTVVPLAFLLLTGLPWAQVEGPLLKRAIAAAGVGYAASRGLQGAPSSPPPVADSAGAIPWTMTGAPPPAAAPADGHDGHAGHAAASAGGAHAGADAAAVAGLDGVVARLARDHGLAGGYRLFLPVGPGGVYTAYVYPGRPQGQRSLYFDRHAGTLLRDVGYADYGVAARAIELGVQLHMGNYFGLANQIVLLLACIAIVALVVAGIVLWWRRRPAGRLAAPPRVADAPVGGAVALLAAAGVLMPVLGASLLAVWAIDRVVTARARA